MRRNGDIERHLRVCRMLRCTLTLGRDAEAWTGLSLVMYARLTPLERALIFAMSAKSLAVEDLSFTLEKLEQNAGAPIPAFKGIDDEATSWAALANKRELRAYFLACSVRLSTREKTSLLGPAVGNTFQ